MSEPVYFCEQIDGTLWQQGEVLGICLPPHTPPPGSVILLQGAITLRYGIELLKTPLYQIIPGYLETENGAVKTGRAAWDFLWAKWQLYPRADIIGVRSDGKPLHVWLRDLDPGEGVKILAYPHPDTPAALGVVAQVAAPAGAELPELLVKYATS